MSSLPQAPDGTQLESNQRSPLNKSIHEEGYLVNGYFIAHKSGQVE